MKAGVQALACSGAAGRSGGGDRLKPELQLLIIGYGNTLRRDDGVGVRLAEAVARLELPGVTVITRHQLLPEMAEPISQAGAVVFVDAAAEPVARVELRRINPAPGSSAQILAHATEPPSMLALAKQMFGRAPKAWCLPIPAHDFGFGEELSPRAEAGLRTALEMIKSVAADPAQRERL